MTRDLIALRRADSHKLGMAVQICTVRYIGLFLWPTRYAVRIPACRRRWRGCRWFRKENVCPNWNG